VLVVETLLYRVFDTKVFMNNVWPILKPCFEETSWRVKYVIANNIDKIVLSVGKENVKKYILGHYVNYLIDSECELKNIAA